MKKDKTQGENTDPPDGIEATANEPPGQEAELAAAENRIAELSAQLEDLRATTGRELAELRTENAAQLAAYCELARSLPGLVPELVGGANLAAVQGSVVTAREAYSRIAANLTPAAGAGEDPLKSLKSFGPLMGAGGGTRSGPATGEDQAARPASERGVNLIYQALAGGKNGSLAR